MTCGLLECPRPVHAHGFCGMHAARLKRTGSPVGLTRRPMGAALEFILTVVASPSLRCGEGDWPFLTNDHGYGVLNYEGRKIRAHALALTLATGPAPIGTPHALHSCDRPVCCVPSCLRWGTPAGNSQDKVDRDRHARGDRHGSAVLSDALVLELRQLYIPFSRRWGAAALGRRFGLNAHTVAAAVAGRTWGHVDGASVRTAYSLSGAA